jgi:hypothetical protein
MATRSINVKIPTVKIIAALEDRLERLQDERDHYPALKQKFDHEYEVWKNQVASLVKPANIKDISVMDLSWRNPGEYEIGVSYAIKQTNDMPKRPEAPKSHGYQEREAIENIENALRILRMTEQEEVSTSTYNAVAKYL